MLTENHIPLKRRVKALILDYLFILIYLLALLGVMMGIYLILLKGIPEFQEWQVQWMSAGTTVIPMIAVFSCLDYGKGSIGKRKAGLVLHFKRKSFGASLLRNLVKFLPWQIAHIGVIHGIYADFDLPSILCSYAGMALAIAMLAMGLARRDRRHLADMAAGTQVQVG